MSLHFAPQKLSLAYPPSPSPFTQITPRPPSFPPATSMYPTVAVYTNLNVTASNERDQAN